MYNNIGLHTYWSCSKARILPMMASFTEYSLLVGYTDNVFCTNECQVSRSVLLINSELSCLRFIVYLCHTQIHKHTNMYFLPSCSHQVFQVPQLECALARVEGQSISGDGEKPSTLARAHSSWGTWNTWWLQDGRKYMFVCLCICVLHTPLYTRHMMCSNFTSGSLSFLMRTIVTGCSSTTLVSAVSIATDWRGYSLLTTRSWVEIRDWVCVEEGECGGEGVEGRV